jgi:broad specificity phosphatase PhoE
VHRKHLSQDEADMRRVAEAMRREPNGDTRLTENGQQQATCLGNYWAPLLERAAREQKLHIFVSPMQRTMQTIEPLVKTLRSKGLVVPATCQHDMYEIPGLVHPNDRQFFKKYSRLVQEGQAEIAQRVWQEHATTGFTPAGLTPTEIVTNFDWVKLDTALASQKADVGWLTHGWENETQITERMERLVNWLYEMRDNLPADNTIVLVGHGKRPDQLVQYNITNKY